MALLEKDLVVKLSTIPNSGNGLFTKKFIAKGTNIVEYKGRITTWKDVENDHENAYIFTVNEDYVIDAKKTLKALARYANDARGLSRVKGFTNNCDYVIEDNKVYIQAKKDIEAGTEILVSYGKEYWDVIRDNIKAAKDKINKIK